MNYPDYIDKEKWIDIPGFVGYYQVSNRGRIRSVEREISQVNGGTIYKRTMKSCIIRTQSLNSGYQIVHLCVAGKRTALTVHSLVARAWLGEKPSGMEINHIDGTRSNNRVDNLEYVTRSENILHSFAHNGGRRKTRAIPVICDSTGEEYPSLSAAAKSKGISPVTIKMFLSGSSKRGGGYVWRLK